MPTRPFLAAALLGATLLPRAAAAATLRPMTTLHAPVVLLSDLFDDAGPLARRVLGPAPAPGERIVVQARQLAAIARMFGVPWHPVSAADTAVLERPGRPLRRADVLAALRPALAGAGATAAADLDVRVPGFTAPMVPADAQPTISVEQLDYDAGNGSFSASVLVTADEMRPLRLHLAGRAEAMQQVFVPARRLVAGTVLRAGDLMPARLHARAVRGEVARDSVQLVGMTLRHSAEAGQPVPLADLERPGTVEQGTPVLLQVETGSLHATTQGIALAAGAPGDRIPVLNPLSHMVVQGEVLPSGIVAVAPASMPLPAAAQTLAQAGLR